MWFLVSIALGGFIIGLFSGCSSSNPRVGMEKGETEVEEKASEKTSLDMLEERTAEVLQLKSDVIILQSEIIQLKSKIIELRRRNAELQNELDKKREEVRLKGEEISKLRRQIGLLKKRHAHIGSSPEDEFSVRYEKALSEYYSGNHRKAITLFTSLLTFDSNHALSDNCQYWIGESYYALGEFALAVQEFKRVFAYGDSNKKDDAQLKLWLCYLKLGDKPKAEEELNRLLTDYSDSEYVDKVKELLKEFDESGTESTRKGSS